MGIYQPSSEGLEMSCSSASSRAELTGSHAQQLQLLTSQTEPSAQQLQVRQNPSSLPDKGDCSEGAQGSHSPPLSFLPAKQKQQQSLGCYVLAKVRAELSDESQPQNRWRLLTFGLFIPPSTPMKDTDLTSIFFAQPMTQFLSVQYPNSPQTSTRWN